MAQTSDPTAHAEILAIRDACTKLGAEHLVDATIYVLAHPCPMCLGSLYYCSPREVAFLTTRESYEQYYLDDRRYFEVSTFYDEFGKRWDQRRLPMGYHPERPSATAAGAGRRRSRRPDRTGIAARPPLHYYLRMHADSSAGRLPDDQASLVVEVFRMLADATRVQVLWSLTHREMSVNELAEHVGKPAPSVSQHLAKLRMARLVRTRREGTTIFYSLENDHVRQLVINAVCNAEHAGPGVPRHHRDRGALRAVDG